MKKLPKEVVVELERRYKNAKDRREAARYHAIWLLSREYTRKQVEKIIGISHTGLGKWVTRYHKFGIEELQTKPQPGNHRYLKNNQKVKLKKLLTKQTPQELGYKDKFWDTKLLRLLVKDKLKVEYKSETSYRELFKWCGFSYHKPDRVNKKQSVKSIEEWERKIKKDWRGIAREIGWYW